jgi:hypothetical protein
MKKTTYAILTAVIVAGLTVPILVAQAGSDVAPVSPDSLEKGLILHLTFDRDETAGRVTDSSGQGNYGKAYGVSWTPNGKRGGAYEFTADGDEIVLANNPSLNPKQLTLAAWIKTSTKDAVWRRIFDKSYTKGYAVSVAGDWNDKTYEGCVSLEMGPGYHLTATRKIVTDGKWHQVVVTFDGNMEKLFVDGTLAARPIRWKKGEALGATSFDLVIGCNRSNLTEDDLGKSFRGLIDEPMMWNRALSTNEVAFLYQSQQ